MRVREEIRKVAEGQKEAMKNEVKKLREQMRAKKER